LDSSGLFNPSIFLFLSHTRIWISNDICGELLRWWCLFLFCWARWNCWSSLCNLSFHNVIFVYPTIFPLQYDINTHSISLPFINCKILGNYSKCENIQNCLYTNSVIFQQWEIYTLTCCFNLNKYLSLDCNIASYICVG